MLDTIRFVVGSDGKPAAVQIDVGVWQQIVAALEDAEDIVLARHALAELERAGGVPDRAGWLRLEELEKEWQRDETL